MPKTTEEKLREIRDRYAEFGARLKRDPALRRRTLLAIGTHRVNPVTGDLEMKPELLPAAGSSTSAAPDA